MAILQMQATYNKIHSKTRVKIKNCFGLLKVGGEGSKIQQNIK